MIDLSNPRVVAALALVGVRYVYGAGKPSDVSRDDVLALAQGVSTKASAGRLGWDCFGSCQAYAVVVGDLDPGQPDRNAHGGAMQALDPVKTPEVGDIALYNRDGDADVEHAAIYVGDGMVVTMSGGGPHTHGDDPNACGQVRPAGNVLVWGRWKSSVKPR